MGQSYTKPAAEPKPSHSSTLTTSSVDSVVFKPKSHLSKVELVSLKFIFDELKSNIHEQECIELKQFLKHLDLPFEVEAGGILLYKSFSYLGSYPLCTGPVQLSFKEWMTAFVVLAGRVDTKDQCLSEDLFFESLSVLPPPDSQPVVPTEIKPTKKPEETHIKHKSETLSLAELGIDFDEEDIEPLKEGGEDEGSKILCSDLTELLFFLLWLGEADNATHDFKALREIAMGLVEHIQHTENNKDSDLPCVSHAQFVKWKEMFSPHLFKPLQSFIIKSLTYYRQEDTSRLLKEDRIPAVDQSHIMTSYYTTLMSWSVSERVLVSKHWTRLYSSAENGFSMNRFEKHVFKYPGPTLLVIKAETKSKTPITLGAYVSQPWKQSKQCWGSADCFLFEFAPFVDVYRPVMNPKTGQCKNDNFVYYHHDKGIGFGALSQNPHKGEGFILWLHNTLQEGVYQHEAYPPQPSLESATRSRQHLDFNIHFDTDSIEVFGMGSEKDRELQEKEWKFDQREADRRAGLNIRGSDGELDKELLKLAGIIDEDKRQDR